MSDRDQTGLRQTGLQPIIQRGAIVTGGSRGIGEAVARALAADGVSVVIASRSAPDLTRVADDILTTGGQAWGVQCDVSNPRQVKKMMTLAAPRLGGVDILVNCAGVASSAKVTKISLNEWDRLFAINATGTLLCIQHVLQPMLDRGWGRIVNLSSVAGKRGDKYVAAYTASKHAVMGLTSAAAAEVVGTGVTINAVCPGYVDTPMTDATLNRLMTLSGRTRDEALAILLRQSGQPRLVRPHEVAHAVLALCAENASAINGESIVVDTGVLR